MDVRLENERIRGALGSLSSRHRTLLALHYFGDLSLHSISKRMAISPQRVPQLHIAAIAKLKKVVARANAG